jgi:methionine synthase I (cobalamin-dependent)/5,10-methylenetetrahydrofolate reductase
MQREDFFERIKKSVIIADGAYGTLIQQMASEPVECVESLNLSQPELITEIHKQYVLSGSEMLKTNTFAANRYILEKYQLGEKAKEINRAGVRLARASAGPASFITGCVGPFIPVMDELAVWQTEDLEYAIREQIETLVHEGIDILLLETYASVEHLLYTLKIAKKTTGIPVIASMATGRGGTTYDGRNILAAAQYLKEEGADVIGINCGYGISAVAGTLAMLAGFDAPVSVMPNAGLPQRVGARLIYGVSEEYFAVRAAAFAEAGAQIIGGCCGTTPAHIKAAADLLKEKRIIHRPGFKREMLKVLGPSERKKGVLLEKFEKVILPVICEIDPPGSTDVTRELEAIKKVVDAGADAVSMAENPLAIAKLSNLAFAAYVRQRMDVDIILHLTGRDRNLIGLESVMLGAWLLGIGGLLLVTGDPSHERGGAANVYDADSIGLIHMAANINRGKKLTGKAACSPANFSIGSAVNPNMQDFGMQLKKLKRKAEAGAVFAMTQPMYEASHVFRFLDAAQHLDMNIFPGLFPILSSRTAEYLHHEVPGIAIPESLRTTLARYESRDDQKKAGLTHMYELIGLLKEQVKGLYLIAPHGNPHILAELVVLIKR